MFDCGFARTIRIEGVFRLEWVPPPDEKMAWFTNMNEVLAEGHQYEHNRDDLDVLSSIPYFEFEVNDVSFFFKVSRKKTEDFNESYSAMTCWLHWRGSIGSDEELLAFFAVFPVTTSGPKYTRMASV